MQQIKLNWRPLQMSRSAHPVASCKYANGIRRITTDHVRELNVLNQAKASVLLFNGPNACKPTD
eukprot:3962403-Karenia_brevis.AAC.1